MAPFEDRLMSKRPSQPAPRDLRQAVAPDDAGAQNRKPGKDEDMPAAGPHARRELTNPMATPGAGALPDPDDDAQESTSG